MNTIKFLLVLLVLTTTACSSVQAGGSALPVPSEWKLVSFGKTGSETQIIEGSSVSLKFDPDGQASGSGGCNSYGAKYETQGDALTFKEIVHTMMACVDEQINQQEAQYFTTLQGASKYEISGNNLIIISDNGESQLNFVKQ